MQTSAIVLAVLSVAFATPAPNLDAYFPNKLSHSAEEKSALSNIDQNSTVKLYFFSRSNRIDAIEVDVTNDQSIKNTTFDHKKDTFFVIHGWQNNYNSPISVNVRDALLEVENVNVFVIDWSDIAQQDYETAFAAVPTVGNVLGNLIKILVKNDGLNLAKTSIVGHSLGAHVAGVAGATLNGEVDYIVGLDPAGPLFSVDRTDNRLDVCDAKFVHVIHTCAGLLGFPVAIGHSDYFPNGGSSQPGCDNNSDYGACSHGRSFEYYQESLISGKFVAQRCDSFNDYEDGKCKNSVSLMGGYNIDKEANGTYFLDTNSDSPFARGG